MSLPFPPRSPRPPVTLPIIANELLFEILAYLPLTSLVSTIQTCWMLHDVGSRVLYRDISVSQRKARRLLKTVCETAQGYAQFIRALTYTATSNVDVYITYVMLCDALPKMSGLLRLTLVIPPRISSFLVYFLNRRSIFLAQPTPNMLPNLSELNVKGDVRLLKLVRHRSLSSIAIWEPLTEESLKYFLDVVTNGQNANPSVYRLNLTLHQDFAPRMSSVLLRLDSAFPSLRKLALQVPAVNALTVSQLLTREPPILPRLRSIKLNDWTLLRPTFLFSKVESLRLQRLHVVSAGNLRPNLEHLAFGSVKWTRESVSSCWKLQENKRIVEEMSEGYLFQEDAEEFSLFWGDVVYEKPPILASIDEVMS